MDVDLAKLAESAEVKLGLTLRIGKGTKPTAPAGAAELDMDELISGFFAGAAMGGGEFAVDDLAGRTCRRRLLITPGADGRTSRPRGESPRGRAPRSSCPVSRPARQVRRRRVVGVLLRPVRGGGEEVQHGGRRGCGTPSK